MACDPYCTHFPVLSACAARLDGPFLEQGLGWYSTPLLHAICAARGGVKLLTIEGLEKWRKRWTAYERPWHHIALASMPADCAPFAVVDHWGLALVDGATEERAPWIRALKNRCGVIVIHDTQAPGAYGYDPLLSQFAYRVEYRGELLKFGPNHTVPWTTAVSDTDNLEWLKAAL